MGISNNELLRDHREHFSSTQVNRAEFYKCGERGLQKTQSKFLLKGKGESVFSTEGVFQLEHNFIQAKSDLQAGKSWTQGKVRTQGTCSSESSQWNCCWVLVHFTIAKQLHYTTPSLRHFLYQISCPNATVFPSRFWTLYYFILSQIPYNFLHYNILPFSLSVFSASRSVCWSLFTNTQAAAQEISLQQKLHRAAQGENREKGREKRLN